MNLFSLKIELVDLGGTQTDQRYTDKVIICHLVPFLCNIMDISCSWMTKCVRILQESQEIISSKQEHEKWIGSHAPQTLIPLSMHRMS